MSTNAINDTGVKFIYDKLQNRIKPLEDAISVESSIKTGNPINFSTKSAQNAVSTIIDLEPIQDLHGYDKPWVGGAGKNKCPVDSGDFIPITTWVSLNNENANTVTNGTKVDLKAGTYTITIAPNTNFNTLQIFDSTGATALVNSSQQINRFTLSTDTYVYIRVKVNDAGGTVKLTFKIQIEQGSDSTTWNPYENLCPISGRTQVGIEGCGVNIWDEQWELGSYSVSDGTPISVGDAIRSKSTNYIAVGASKQYYVKYPGAYNLNVCFYDEFKNYISNFVIGGSGVITTPERTKYLRFNVSSSYGTTYNNDISINYPSTDTSYHAYTESNSLTIQFGETVYGCHVSVEAGGVVVDRGSIDLSTLPWVREGTNVDLNAGYRFGVYLPNTYSWNKDIISSILEQYDDTMTASNHSYQAHIGIGITALSGQLYIYAPTYKDMTVSELETALSGQTMVIYLATPITINLTPNIINLLKGVNNISVSDDYSTITLTYRSGEVATLGDLKEQIETYDPILNLLASLADEEEDYVATKSYYQGNYLAVKGKLYQASLAISNGEAIVPNTNVVASKIGSLLYAFLSQINQINAKLPTVPNGIGNYFLMASRTVGGGLSYAWVYDNSGEWDYSHITYWYYRDFWRYWSDDVQLISTQQTSHFIIHNDVSVGGAPTLNWEAIYGIPVPDGADTMKLILPSGAQTTTLFLKISGTNYYQVLNPDATGVTITNQTFDLNAMRAEAGSGVQIYYLIAVAKSGNQGISESEVIQYMPSITYEKEE